MTEFTRCDICGEEHRSGRHVQELSFSVDGIQWDSWDVCTSHMEWDEEGEPVSPNVAEKSFESVEEEIETFEEVV